MNTLTIAKEQLSQLEMLLDEMKDISIGRSNYQITHFVVGQHDTPARQRQQVLGELNAIMFNIADAVDDIEIAKLDIEALADDKRSEIKKRKLIRKILSIEILVEAKLRECKTLLEILNKIPKFNREEFEQEEEEYWKRRLARQFELSAKFGGNFGNADAILQMVTDVGKYKPELPVKVDDVISLFGIKQLERTGGNERK